MKRHATEDGKAQSRDNEVACALPLQAADEERAPRASPRG
jgi:hypothetical protein